MPGNESIVMLPATVMAPETKSLLVRWMLTKPNPLVEAINAP